MSKLLSVIIPAYNEKENIAAAAKRIGDVLTAHKIAYELVFVDDGSEDGTWDEISELSSKDERILGVSFSRNFGKEAAITAGLKAACGDACVTIDCDLQHPPEKIPEMYGLWLSGYEVIEGVKSDRGRESFVYKFFAGLFYRLMNGASGASMDNASDFKLLDHKAVDALLSLPEKYAFFRALSSWVGFRTAKVEFEVEERAAGTSKWSSGKLIKYALSNMASFTSAPLMLSAVFGAVFLIAALAVLITGFFTDIPCYAVTVLLLLTGGLILICMGILGYYVGRIYDELKGRPRYIVSKRTDDRYDGKD